jgi:hypothetical protein
MYSSSPSNPEIKEVHLIAANGDTLKAEFWLWDSEPHNPEFIRLSLRFGTTNITVKEKDYFSAMCLIRLELEKQNLQLVCYGASKNVFPSPMSLGMGAGEKAYRLTIGEQAKINSLVSIFDSGSDVVPATVAEQRAFFELWTKSIRVG